MNTAMGTMKQIIAGTFEIEGKGTISIEWFEGTNEHGDCWYGFTPFGSYNLYKLDSKIWIVSSICGKEVTFDTEEEAIEAIEKDFKSRIFELFGKPYLPSDRIVDSWGWGDVEEFEIGEVE